MTWKHHIETTEAKTLPTYIRTYSLFKSGRLGTKMKLTLYKALIKSVTTYGCPTWEHEADAQLLKLQRLQNGVLRAIANLDRCPTSPRFVHGFQISLVYEYITKLCRTQAEIILNHVNPNSRGIGQEETRCRKYKRLKLGRVRPNLLHKPALTETLYVSCINVT
jgi:hypothetical protein